MEDNRRILVIDDSPSIHEDFKKALGSKRSPLANQLESLEASLAGQRTHQNHIGVTYQLEFASQGEAGVKKFLEAYEKNEPYAVVFVDMRMPPGWDGVKTIEEIRRITYDIEIVIISAYSDYSWQEVIHRLGVTDRLLFLSKPFELIEVQQIALALTTKWSLRKRLERHVDELEQKVCDAIAKVHEEKAKSFQYEKMAAVGELAGGVAHEINTPLNTILMLSQELEESLVGSSVDLNRSIHITGVINSTVGKIKRIIDALLSYSRTRARGADELHNWSVSEVLDSTLLLCSESLKQAGVKLHLPAEAAAKALIRARKTEVTQGLLNLINNAADAVVGSSDRWIRIEVEETKEKVRVIVSDSGPGIDSDIRKKIYDPFFTTKEFGCGSGLGLSITSGIMNAHGGHVYLNDKSQVTQFVMEFPKVIGESIEQTTKAINDRASFE